MLIYKRYIFNTIYIMLTKLVNFALITTFLISW